MKIDILTLFPKMFENFLGESIIKRAIDKKIVNINTYNIRDYSDSKHKKVDDTPYGGGPGMLLKCQPVFDAVKDLKQKDTKVILTTPDGIKYNQKLAQNLSKERHLIIICGHYEGFDERIKTLCDMEISIGDYVLTGGEIPSMVITDSVVRLLDNVIEEESHLNDSFSKDLLEYPQYTKPEEFNNLKVPEVLLSGDHKEIEKWRLEQSIKKTKELRPELLKNKFILINKNIYKKGILNFKKEPYSFNPKNNAKSDKLINVKKMEIYNDDFIEIIVKKNIEKKLQNLLKLILESSEEEDGAARVINEAKRIKNIMVTKYNKILKEEYINLELKRMEFLISRIKIKPKQKEEIKEERVR